MHLLINGKCLALIPVFGGRRFSRNQGNTRIEATRPIGQCKTLDGPALVDDGRGVVGPGAVGLLQAVPELAAVQHVCLRSAACWARASAALYSDLAAPVVPWFRAALRAAAFSFDFLVISPNLPYWSFRVCVPFAWVSMLYLGVLGCGAASLGALPLVCFGEYCALLALTLARHKTRAPATFITVFFMGNRIKVKRTTSYVANCIIITKLNYFRT